MGISKTIQHLIFHHRLFHAMVSYSLILTISLNLSFANSPIIGITASVLFFLINGSLLGRIFFKSHSSFLRPTLGFIVLLVLMGLTSWATMIIYNLDSLRTTIALAAVATIVIVLAKLDENNLQPSRSLHDDNARKSSSKIMRSIELVYLLSILASLYLLFTSRSGELSTVWQNQPFTFLPLFFVSTLLLVIIVVADERTGLKLIFVIVHSFLAHALFSIVLPAGDIGGQQMLLGRTRLIYESAILNGWPPWPAESFLGQIYSWFRPTNFQAALSIVLARMLSLDLLQIHLFLVPILWSVFAPVAMFLTTKKLTKNDNISVMSSLLILLFPTFIYWGAISVPNSLGFIFFGFSLVFLLQYLHSNDWKTVLLLAIFCFTSFLGHFLTGILSFSLFLFAIALKEHKANRAVAPKTTKTLLVTSFLFGSALLPLSLVYLRLFYPISTRFSFESLGGQPILETIWLFIFSQPIDFTLTTALLHVAGPIIGMTSIAYALVRMNRRSNQKEQRITLYYLLAAFLLFAVDYRILKFFMIGLPFAEGRLWLFQYFTLVPFLSVAVYNLIGLLQRRIGRTRIQLPKRLFPAISKTKATALATTGILIVAYAFSCVSLSTWITLSVYRAYPHFGPLQTTSYELEAARYIDANTAEKYIVIADQWMIFAGQMIVGVFNPRAYYFSHTSPDGISLYIQMKNAPNQETMVEAMKYNNSTVAYFVIEKPRVGSRAYEACIQEAQQNGLETFRTFNYEGEEKLRVFWFRLSVEP